MSHAKESEQWEAVVANWLQRLNCFEEASSKTRAILAVGAEWQHPEVDVVNVALEGDQFVCPRFGQAQKDAVLPPALVATNGYEEGAGTANVSAAQV